MMIYIKRIELPEMPDDIYAAGIPAVRQLAAAGEMSFSSPVTFFIGENGSGKSTLLEAIAAASGFNAEGGSRETMFSTMDTHSELYEYLKLVRGAVPKDGFFLRAESFYNVASYLDQSGSHMTRFGGQSLHAQSHGESFMQVVKYRFEGHGLYLLDEPEAALSVSRTLSLLAAIDRLVKQESQFIIATHSPLLMAYPGAEIVEFSESGMRAVEYRETESYTLTRRFISEPERMMSYLFEEND